LGSFWLWEPLTSEKLGLLWVRLGSFWVRFRAGEKANVFISRCKIKVFESAGGGQDWVRFARKGKKVNGKW
jgi:hypothetical protein